MKIFIILFPIIFLLNCGDSKKQLHKEIVQALGKEIHIDTSELLANNKFFHNDINKKLKLLVYTDSAECSMCQMRLPEWKIKIRELKKYKDDLSVFFIVNTKDIKTIEMNLDFIGFKNTVFYDTLNVFKSQNILSTNSLLPTFLLDENNRIVMLGNPLERAKLWELYKNTIKEKIQLQENE